jgi:hypothetical protein
MPFDPCFNLERTDEVSFRGSVSGMGFAYCDFHHQGAASMMMARAVARPRSSRPASVDGSQEIAARVETPKVERSKVEPVKSETTGQVSSKPDVVPELRRTTE